MPASYYNPADNFGTVVGKNPDCYVILALRAVYVLSIVCWDISLNGITVATLQVYSNHTKTTQQ